jgi:hypothetical protein
LASTEKDKESAHACDRNRNHNCDDIEQVRSRKILIVWFHWELMPVSLVLEPEVLAGKIVT